MALTMETYNREQGIHRVDIPTSGSPAQPVATTSEPPTQLGEPQPEEPQPSPPPTEPGESPSEGEEGSEEEALSADGRSQTPRPFVSRLIRENQTYKTTLAQREAQLAYLTEQLQQRSAASQSAPEPEAPQAPQPDQAPPRYEDYQGDNERYWRDLARFEAQQHYVQAEAQREQARQRAEIERVEATVRANLQPGFHRYADFGDTLQLLDMQLTPELINGPIKAFVASGDSGPRVLDYLAKHADALEDLADRTPQGAYKYLTTLAARLDTTPPERRGAPASGGHAPPVPGAPALPPVRPLTGHGSTPPPSANPRDIAIRGGPGSFKTYTQARGYKL